jgi:hypothetical protein
MQRDAIAETSSDDNYPIKKRTYRSNKCEWIEPTGLSAGTSG